MDYIIYKKYIDTLIKNQNNTNIPCMQDIYGIKDYDRLLRPVLKVIKENPHASLSTLRMKLFLSSGLKELIHYFVHDTMITPGLILDFGTEKNRDTIICGNRQEVTLKGNNIVEEKLPIEQDTIFDLASTSKLFTSVGILYLAENKLLDVFEPVVKYAPEFKNLGKTTIYDLLKFRVNIVTDKRVDKAENKEEALNILLSVHPSELKKNNAYTDMGAMVLRIVAEKITKIPFQKYLETVIFRMYGMNSTYLNVPSWELHRVANENFNTVVYKNGIFETNVNNQPGTVHDPKAKAIGHSEGIAPGHAGFFSSKDDMIKFASSLMNEKILSKETLYSISDTETGFIDEKSITRFYGSLVYLKQPDPKFLSVYPPLSGRAFMSPGFAGTELVVDPLNKISLFVASPRLHNRIYQINDEESPKIKVNNHNKKTYLLSNGEEKIICNDYTKEKEVLVTLALNLALQYQLLEKLRPNEKEMHLVRELD